MVALHPLPPTLSTRPSCTGSVAPLAPCHSHLPAPSECTSIIARSVCLKIPANNCIESMWWQTRIVFDRDMADQALRQLAAATPTATEHAQVGTNSQRVQAPADLLQEVTALARLGITHDRHLQEIENKMSLTIWIYDATMQTELQVTRQAWVDRRLQGEPQTNGMSQRVVMWSKLIMALRQAFAAIKPEEVQLASERGVENRLCGMQRRPTGAGDGQGTSPLCSLSQPDRARNLPPQAYLQRNLSRARTGSET